MIVISLVVLVLIACSAGSVWYAIQFRPGFLSVPYAYVTSSLLGCDSAEGFLAHQVHLYGEDAYPFAISYLNDRIEHSSIGDRYTPVRYLARGLAYRLQGDEARSVKDLEEALLILDGRDLHWHRSAIPYSWVERYVRGQLERLSE